MIYFAVVIFTGYLVLYLLSHNQRPEWDAERFMIPFHKMGFYLYKKVGQRKNVSMKKQQIKKDLEQLYPMETKEVLCTVYYVKKIGLVLCIILVGTFIGLVVSLQSQKEKVLHENGEIQRAQTKEKEITLIAKRTKESEKEIKSEKEISVVVQPSYFKGQELEIIQSAFHQKLPELILGNNNSLEAVDSDLDLRENYEEYPFTVKWNSLTPELIANSGKLWEISKTDEKQGEKVLLKARVTYGEHTWEENVQVTICNSEEMKEKLFYEELENLITEAQMKNRENTTWQLPLEYKGEHLEWEEKRNDYGISIFIFFAAVGILVYWMSDFDLHKELQKRRDAMKREYPDVVRMLTLYLGAGMSVRNALFRIVTDAEHKNSYICKEIAVTLREIQNGSSEVGAYERLGKRTGLKEYVRVCAFMTQNIKKGNKTLLLCLKEEVKTVTDERMQSGRKLLEEAETKMLLPMVMMLAVVMLMITIPAFGSMG